jgi:23S rRNA maturation mini-RNase III
MLIVPKNVEVNLEGFKASTFDDFEQSLLHRGKPAKSKTWEKRCNKEQWFKTIKEKSYVREN